MFLCPRHADTNVLVDYSLDARWQQGDLLNGVTTIPRCARQLEGMHLRPLLLGSHYQQANVHEDTSLSILVPSLSCVTCQVVHHTKAGS